jgi:UDP-N-acetylglucosamine--N-acetylmuramyl-(pentapeptide) pyrophosphoryl-undecaprenol N-acetylglucosamine transferase
MAIQKITITAGGTGGHILPGLTLAKTFQDKGISVTWLGSNDGMEQKLVTRAGIPLDSIAAKRFGGKSLLSKITALFTLLAASFAARKILKQQRPELLISMGGFVSVAGSIAAKMLKIPVVIHEQNAIMGAANKFTSKFATSVLSGLPLHKKYPKAQFVGNPVSENLLNLTESSARYDQREGKLRLLILGGSLGANKYNHIISQSLSNIRPDLCPQIWHQTGLDNEQDIIEIYKNNNIDAKVDGYIDDIASAYAWADLVISRAGAMSVSEIAASGIASVFVPYPDATGKHQDENAKLLVKTGGAKLVEQHKLARELPQIISTYLSAETLDDIDRKRHILAEMAQKVYKTQLYCDANKIADSCLKIVS